MTADSSAAVPASEAAVATVRAMPTEPSQQSARGEAAAASPAGLQHTSPSATLSQHQRLQEEEEEQAEGAGQQLAVTNQLQLPASAETARQQVSAVISTACVLFHRARVALCCATQLCVSPP